MDSVTTIKQAKSGLLSNLRSRIDDILDSIDVNLRTKQFYVNGGAEDLHRFCVTVKTELNQKYDK